MIGSVGHLNEQTVAAYADGVLPAVSRMRAAQHLTGCPECAAAVAAQQETALALRQAGATLSGASSELVSRLLQLPRDAAAQSAGPAADPLAMPPFGTVLGGDPLPSVHVRGGTRPRGERPV